MKYFNSKWGVLALAAVLTAGCADLDTAPSGGTVTTDQKKAVVTANPARISASVTGITTLFSVFQATNTNHNDFGYPALMLITDSRGIDLVSDDIGFNWFSGPLTLQDNNISSSTNYIMWRTAYNQIAAANDVTKLVASGVTDNDLMFYRAQALAIRAFDYFVMAQLHQLTYVGNEDALCVPLITEANADDAAQNGTPRATVREVYAQILADLDEAITLLENSTTVRSDKRYVSAAVAHGIRARVRLVMQNWSGAAEDAQYAITNGGATPKSMAEVKTPTFKSLDENDWLWGIKIAETDRVVTSGIVNWPSHMGSLCYGYASVGAWRRVSTQLYNLINSTDARKGWFLNANGTSANLSTAQQNYLTNTAGAPAYTQVKFAPYQDVINQSVNANDIPLMRVDEMYLILAEAQAMGGSPSTGLATLKSYVNTYRDASYRSSASTAEEVQEAVWIQRRIELWGEGLSYFDLLRLKKGIDRRGCGFSAATTFNVSASDYITVYPIPEKEVEGNDMISDKDNNPATTTPSPVN